MVRRGVNKMTSEYVEKRIGLGLNEKRIRLQVNKLRTE